MVLNKGIEGSESLTDMGVGIGGAYHGSHFIVLAYKLHELQHVDGCSGGRRTK